MAHYSTIVQFKLGKEIRFPDFSMTYTEEKSVHGPGNAPWKMTTHYFELRNGDSTQQVAWSSGTGDIAPSPFEFNQGQFMLELVFSEKLKSDTKNFTKLEDAELVISKSE